ncbi:MULTISPECIES: alpha/beta hydrolase [unclassified Arthrobacter]|uniref:alpha/beta hydrolase n=1 Tax=unclassified Arthrobacter TaxID=235627 RepID=UPI001D136753|nr:MULTISPECIES: alpha/beta hydrolase [unclassified Arthrobacter]MCC3276478.1 alpha/beta hydrolase [Arthrobacter sp. zg-Y20]MCC3280265.1 alpha/beta hydrolase [Arthrobacter sp. zg-Y40]MCC9178536.1 alpha/beta hydrolase [Arthrobacter sp. zg-Y750]MDK1316638.1 alpha/beta hydrolase [Arthrobacter sp. zg.Y20]MDK1328793.1 alpha/beta hydrolase [Arthrobacter sp. zg-Y1143]
MTTATARRRFPRMAAAAVSALLLAAATACTPGDGTDPGAAEPGPAESATTASADIIGDVPEELQEFYSQEVAWEECEGDFRCATVTVPMDYEDPGAGTLELSTIMASADGEAEGTILINPGGPGGSGYDFVRQSLDQVASDRLRENYNVLGFDPRGVGRSSPVKCLDDEEMDAARAEYVDPGTPEGLEEARLSAKALADACAAETGDLLGFVDTASAARDMDVLRAVVGDQKLNYLGFSYGTFLGATYAELFPGNVGRLVLDGALDPSSSNEEVTLGQAAAFEKAIRAYVQDCLTGRNCPLEGTPDQAVQTIQELLASVEASPMTAADGRVVTVSTFVSGFILPLYDDANWPVLSQALEGALKDGDPTMMLRLADISADRDEDGHYKSNSTVAFSAVNCLDYPMVSDDAQMAADARDLEAASPTIGKYLAYGGITCEVWPHAPVNEPHPIKAAGAADLLVIGTTGDPATPYEWAQALAAQMDSAVLVTWEGEGHTAYGRGSQCVEDVVDDYFVDGTVPEEDLVCS